MAVFIAGFLAGVYSVRKETFPYPQIRDALRTAKALKNTITASNQVDLGKHLETTAVPTVRAAEVRWTVVEDSVPRLPIIANGSLNQFLEYCPDYGCIAVAFGDSGNVVEAWPYRPDEIYEADITGDAYPHEFLSFEPSKNVYPVSVQRYANGDV